MIKKLTYENLDNGSRMEILVELLEDNGRWSASIVKKEGSDTAAPVFYGHTSEQAERQLRKVFEKDYDLVSEMVVNP